MLNSNRFLALRSIAVALIMMMGASFLIPGLEARDAHAQSSDDPWWTHYAWWDDLLNFYGFNIQDFDQESDDTDWAAVWAVVQTEQPVFDATSGDAGRDQFYLLNGFDPPSLGAEHLVPTGSGSQMMFLNPVDSHLGRQATPMFVPPGLGSDIWDGGFELDVIAVIYDPSTPSIKPKYIAFERSELLSNVFLIDGSSMNSIVEITSPYDVPVMSDEARLLLGVHAKNSWFSPGVDLRSWFIEPDGTPHVIDAFWKLMPYPGYDYNGATPPAGYIPGQPPAGGLPSNGTAIPGGTGLVVPPLNEILPGASSTLLAQLEAHGLANVNLANNTWSDLLDDLMASGLPLTTAIVDDYFAMLPSIEASELSGILSDELLDGIQMLGPGPGYVPQSAIDAQMQLEQDQRNLQFQYITASAGDDFLLEPEVVLESATDVDTSSMSEQWIAIHDGDMNAVFDEAEFFVEVADLEVTDFAPAEWSSEVQALLDETWNDLYRDAAADIKGQALSDLGSFAAQAVPANIADSGYSASLAAAQTKWMLDLLESLGLPTGVAQQPGFVHDMEVAARMAAVQALESHGLAVDVADSLQAAAASINACQMQVDVSGTYGNAESSGYGTFVSEQADYQAVGHLWEDFSPADMHDYYAETFDDIQIDLNYASVVNIPESVVYTHDYIDYTISIDDSAWMELCEALGTYDLVNGFGENLLNQLAVRGRESARIARSAAAVASAEMSRLIADRYPQLEVVSTTACDDSYQLAWLHATNAHYASNVVLVRPAESLAVGVDHAAVSSAVQGLLSLAECNQGIALALDAFLSGQALAPPLMAWGAIHENVLESFDDDWETPAQVRSAIEAAVAYTGNSVANSNAPSAAMLDLLHEEIVVRRWNFDPHYRVDDIEHIARGVFAQADDGAICSGATAIAAGFVLLFSTSDYAAEVAPWDTTAAMLALDLPRFQAVALASEFAWQLAGSPDCVTPVDNNPPPVDATPNDDAPPNTGSTVCHKKKSCAQVHAAVLQHEVLSHHASIRSEAILECKLCGVSSSNVVEYLDPAVLGTED